MIKGSKADSDINSNSTFSDPFCLKAMRSHEGNEAQVCYFIIQLLLLKPNDFRNRVSDFVKENSPEHWLQNDWHTKHMSYHKVSKLIKSFCCNTMLWSSDQLKSLFSCKLQDSSVDSWS